MPMTSGNVTAALSDIEREFADFSLGLNKSKTKYILLTSGMHRIESRIMAGNYTFDVVNEFVSLNFTIDQTKNQQMFPWSQ